MYTILTKVLMTFFYGNIMKINIIVHTLIILNKFLRNLIMNAKGKRVILSLEKKSVDY